jgi:hypothetical protein
MTQDGYKDAPSKAEDGEEAVLDEEEDVRSLGTATY